MFRKAEDKEKFRQLGAQNIDVVLWTTGEDNMRKLREVLIHEQIC